MNQHGFDALSFFFGAIFVVAGLLLLTGGFQGVQLQWVGPVVAVLLGLVILFAVRPRRPSVEETATPDEA